MFALAHGVLIGLLGASATFAPLIADTSLWFVAAPRHRGGDLRQRQLPRGRGLAADRAALRRERRLAPDLHRASACSASASMLAAGAAAARAARRWRRPRGAGTASGRAAAAARPVARARLQALLCVAGVACCVAMSMPQVHIVAYCGDLGYGAARGARDAVADARPAASSAGWSRAAICDRIGGIAHAAARLGAAGRRAAAVPAVRRALASLYVVSALFGLFQGGIVPMLRDHRARILPAGARPARASAS